MIGVLQSPQSIKSSSLRAEQGNWAPERKMWHGEEGQLETDTWQGGRQQDDGGQAWNRGGPKEAPATGTKSFNEPDDARPGQGRRQAESARHVGNNSPHTGSHSMPSSADTWRMPQQSRTAVRGAPRPGREAQHTADVLTLDETCTVDMDQEPWGVPAQQGPQGYPPNVGAPGFRSMGLGAERSAPASSGSHAPKLRETAWDSSLSEAVHHHAGEAPPDSPQESKSPRSRGGLPPMSPAYSTTDRILRSGGSAEGAVGRSRSPAVLEQGFNMLRVYSSQHRSVDSDNWEDGTGEAGPLGRSHDDDVDGYDSVVGPLLHGEVAVRRHRSMPRPTPEGQDSWGHKSSEEHHSPTRDGGRRKHHASHSIDENGSVVYHFSPEDQHFPRKIRSLPRHVASGSLSSSEDGDEACHFSPRGRKLQGEGRHSLPRHIALGASLDVGSVVYAPGRSKDQSAEFWNELRDLWLVDQASPAAEMTRDSPDPVLVLGRGTSRILSANPAAVHSLGLGSETDAKTKCLVDMAPQLTLELWRRRMADMSDPGCGEVKLELRLKRSKTPGPLSGCWVTVSLCLSGSGHQSELIGLVSRSAGPIPLPSSPPLHEGPSSTASTPRGGGRGGTSPWGTRGSIKGSSAASTPRGAQAVSPWGSAAPSPRGPPSFASPGFEPHLDPAPPATSPRGASQWDAKGAVEGGVTDGGEQPTIAVRKTGPLEGDKRLHSPYTGHNMGCSPTSIKGQQMQGMHAGAWQGANRGEPRGRGSELLLGGSTSGGPRQAGELRLGTGVQRMTGLYVSVPQDALSVDMEGESDEEDETDEEDDDALIASPVGSPDRAVVKQAHHEPHHGIRNAHAAYWVPLGESVSSPSTISPFQGTPRTASLPRASYGALGAAHISTTPRMASLPRTPGTPGAAGIPPPSWSPYAALSPGSLRLGQNMRSSVRQGSSLNDHAGLSPGGPTEAGGGVTRHGGGALAQSFDEDGAQGDVHPLVRTSAVGSRRGMQPETAEKMEALWKEGTDTDEGSPVLGTLERSATEGMIGRGGGMSGGGGGGKARGLLRLSRRSTSRGESTSPVDRVQGSGDQSERGSRRLVKAKSGSKLNESQTRASGKGASRVKTQEPAKSKAGGANHKETGTAYALRQLQSVLGPNSAAAALITGGDVIRGANSEVDRSTIARRESKASDKKGERPTESPRDSPGPSLHRKLSRQQVTRQPSMNAAKAQTPRSQSRPGVPLVHRAVTPRRRPSTGPGSGRGPIQEQGFGDGVLPQGHQPLTPRRHPATFSPPALIVDVSEQGPQVEVKRKVTPADGMRDTWGQLNRIQGNGAPAASGRMALPAGSGSADVGGAVRRRPAAPRLDVPEAHDAEFEIPLEIPLKAVGVPGVSPGVKSEGAVEDSPSLGARSPDFDDSFPALTPTTARRVRFSEDVRVRKLVKSKSGRDVKQLERINSRSSKDGGAVPTSPGRGLGKVPSWNAIERGGFGEGSPGDASPSTPPVIRVASWSTSEGAMSPSTAPVFRMASWNMGEKKGDKGLSRLSSRK